MATFSVVVPCFNGARFLGAAIESALAQDPPVDEILIQDGGSTDGSREIAEGFGDPRIRFASEPDRGQSDALNRAIAKARGEWIIWLNVDDLLYPGLTAQAADDVDLVYGDFDWIDEHGTVVRHMTTGAPLTVDRLLTEGCFFFSGAALFRRALLQHAGPIDLDLRFTMDYELYLRFAPYVRARYVTRTLGAFRVHGDSKTSGLNWGTIKETARIRRRYGGYGPRTRGPVVINQVKQLVDLATLPVRRRLGVR